jgi:signal transduction histidine kinase
MRTLALLYRTLSTATVASAESRELERTNIALRELNADLEAFSYSVSHDLRAPLRAIEGFSQIIVRDHADELSAEAQRYIAIVRRNALEMGVLIDGLLEFSRLGQRQLSKREVDMQKLCAQVVEELRSTPDGEQAVISIGSLPSARAEVLARSPPRANCGRRQPTARRDCVLGARQRRRLRHEPRRQTVQCLPAASQRRGVRGHRRRLGARRTDRQAARRTRVG